jgi:hypothetical protein
MCKTARNSGPAPSRHQVVDLLRMPLAYLLFDVGAPVDLPSIKNRLTERILTEEAVHEMFAATKNERNAALVRLIYAAGLS